MSNYPSHILQWESYLEWAEYLQRFPWQWHCTLTFDERTDYFKTLRHFRKWRLKLIDKEKLRIAAYVMCSCKYGRIHYHALMIGRNRNRKTLLRCSCRHWETRWPFIARIIPVTDNFRVCDYIAKHLLGFKSDHAQIDSYDRGLLREAMNPQNDPFDGFDGLSTTTESIIG